MSQNRRFGESRNFKRKRTAHACEECRSRKSRCDGGRPCCDKCSEMGFICRYSQPKRSSKSSISAGQLAFGDTSGWLAERLDNMERLLEKLVSKDDVGIPPYAPHSPPDTLSMPATQLNDNVDGMGCMTFADEDDAGHFGREISTLETLVCIVQSSLTGNQISLGPTSNATFLQHIITAVKGLQRVNNPQSSLESQSEWPSPNLAAKKPPPTVTSNISTDSSELPPYDKTIALLQRYFQFTGDMFPYLHKATILSYLGHGHQPRQEEFQPEERCLVNTCLAFASVHGAPDHTRKDNMRSARVYFEVARSTLPEILSKKPDVETSKFPHSRRKWLC